MKQYDLIVIGGGAGGLTAAAGGANFGAKVALIDKGSLGGDCLWTGCVPTKSLIQSAKILHTAKKANIFDLEVHGYPNFKVAKERLNQSIATIQKHDDDQRFIDMGIDVYHGGASFKNANEIRIDGQTTIRGKRIVIATGSRPMIPPIEGIKETGFLTNETALQLEKQPKSLIVVGGGPIGLEFAQSFSRFGTKVTVVEMGTSILGKEDSELVPYVIGSLKKDGVEFITGAKVLKAENMDSGKQVIIEQNNQQKTLLFEEILLASGRVPNTDKLELENAGIRSNRGFITVNQKLQTNVPHIYAIGDVNGYYPFTHKAGYEGKLVVSNAVFGLKRNANYSNLPWVTYTDPELFHLGLTEEEATNKGKEIKVYKTPLDDVDRFVSDHETNGLIKIITDKKGMILGAHAVGPGAGDFMQEVVFAKQYGHKIGSISNVIHAYPTHVGGVQRTADLYWREKLVSSSITNILKKYVKWFR
ncbi:dihydrolipoyl dehydrogenase family protein [Chengkuizengella marina]|uniref:Pyridine nucleotide-disulfide oxidoreductase n=1 Tax=Chengkuizengella marina TaxID=2507566 RepID=A0A6N9Q0M5_9BACL|nr:FAD-dependent oxidoreductase [Chengkuizengella marina]NBI27660.1 pyridine nucleotide-disulfide oxidoreductase [Chengkuizengella marina]